MSDRREKFEKFIKILNKKPPYHRKAEIQFLLEHEKMTLENVEHCFNTNNGTCGCKIHKGQTRYIFCIIPAISKGPTLPKYWLSVRRKDAVFDFIKKWINYDYVISKEEYNLIYIQESTYFRPEIMWKLKNMKDKYDKLVKKAEYGTISRKDLKHHFQLLSSDLAILRKSLSAKQRNLFCIDFKIKNLKEPKESIEELSTIFLDDHLDFDPLRL